MKVTAAGLVFLTLVVGFATRAGMATSLYVALLCAISFDYYFLPPVHTFRLAGIQEWIEMLSFLVSSLVVGQLAERARRQTRQAQQRRDDVERLYALSQDMMLHEDANRLIRELPLLLKRHFHLDEVVLFVRDHGTVLCHFRRGSVQRAGQLCVRRRRDISPRWPGLRDSSTWRSCWGSNPSARWRGSRTVSPERLRPGQRAGFHRAHPRSGH